MRADQVNRHVVHRKVTMLAERTNTLASEFTHSGTGHLRWKATATLWSGSDSGIMRKRDLHVIWLRKQLGETRGSLG